MSIDDNGPLSLSRVLMRSPPNIGRLVCDSGNEYRPRMALETGDPALRPVHLGRYRPGQRDE